ncbi:MAG: YHS domain-containing (seleno)protein [Candidatus Rokuibacteriota bacterium]
MKTRTLLSVAVMAIALGPGSARAAGPVNTNGAPLALGGYDVVAYFTEGKPVVGQAAHEAGWNGARWRFASAEHRDRFLKEPERFAPRYGGYCAFAVSRGYTATVAPEAWRIVDGRLYLNYSTDVQKLWEQDIPGNVQKADTSWPGVLAK